VGEDDRFSTILILYLQKPISYLIEHLIPRHPNPSAAASLARSLQRVLEPTLMIGHLDAG
jgi:hypothetical protein